MADRSDRSRITVPNGFRELLGALCREILRHQPKNIIEFSAQYFEQKLKERDGEIRPLLRDASSRDMIQHSLDSSEITAEVEEKAAVKIQAAYRGHNAREQYKQLNEETTVDSCPETLVLSFPAQQVLKMQAAPTPYFDEEATPLIDVHESEARLVQLPTKDNGDRVRVMPLVDPAHLADSMESALAAMKLREWVSTVYVQSPRGQISLRPSKFHRPLPMPMLPHSHSCFNAYPPAELPPLPTMLLLRADGSICPLCVVKREDGLVIVTEQQNPAMTDYIVVPVSGPEVGSADPEAVEDSHLAGRLAAAYLSHNVPSAATLSEYISMRLKGHVGPTGSYHRRSIGALRSRTMSAHMSPSVGESKTEASVSSESSFITRDSRSFALPPPPPNTPVTSLAQLNSVTVLALTNDSDADFTSATSMVSFLVPPPPPNTPASSVRSGSVTSEGATSDHLRQTGMTGYLSDSQLSEVNPNVGRDTLSAPDVALMVDSKSRSVSVPASRISSNAPQTSSYSESRTSK